MTGAKPGAVPAKTPEEAFAASARKQKMIAAVLLALAAVALWGASRLVWATVAAEDDLSPMRTFEINGSDWSPWLTPLALVFLAAIAAALTVRGWGLRLIAVLVAVGGVVAAVPAISLLTGNASADYAAKVADIPDRFIILLVDTHKWVGVIVLLGTVLAVASGVLLMRAARGAGAASSKYQTPAARREDAEREIFRRHEEKKAADSTAPAAADADSAPAPTSERTLWEALDSGLDPTDLDDENPDDKR